MKRRITTEQLNELTNEQKQKLKRWWKPETGDYYTAKNSIMFYNKDTDNEFEMGHMLEKDALPLLDIGQMIELLGIKLVSCVQYVTPCWQAHFNAKEYVMSELCDALWEAVKKKIGAI